MDTAIVIAVIGALVSILGWIVNSILNGVSQRRLDSLTFQIEHTQQQLQELYGPLAFLLIEGRQAYQELLAALGRDFVFIEGTPLPEHEQALWIFWAEHDFLPRNEKITALVANRTHLIEGRRMPESWVKFLEHASSWQINHAKWQNLRTEYSWHSRVNWPSSFENDVLLMFETLKERHAKLMGQRAH
jgi:hypothetical protein